MLYKGIASSQDPTGETVANKVKGAILACSGLVIFAAAQIFHVQLSANDVISLATEVSTLAGLVWAAYGCILHVVTWLFTVKAQQ